jgi:signal transduction histidine kinase/ligand-binding sensor domain-containing protein
VRFGPDGSIATPIGGFMAHETPDGSVWIAYHDQYRLVRYYQGVFSEVPLSPAIPHQWTGMFPEQGVLAMATDVDGALVMLTPAGFVRAIDGKLGAPELLRLPFNTAELPKVWSMLVDREGNRWVGTLSTGLFRFRRAPVSAYTKDEGLSDSPFHAVFQDRDGHIWLGGDQLYWFDGDRFHLFPGLSDIRAIAQTTDGDLWFGGSGGLYQLRSGTLTHFKISAPAVIAIHQDRQGAFWILEQTYIREGGLFRFRNGQFEKVASEARIMLEDRDGGLWLFGSQGLRYLRGQKTVLYDAAHGAPYTSITSICQDPTGTLWMSTTGGGLYRFRNGRFTAITTREGLHSDDPGSLIEDGNGSLWFGSNSGVVRVSLKDLNDVADGKLSRLSLVSYGIAEGMRSSECDSEPWKARDGRFWFPTERGVVAVDPTVRNSIPPPVVLEEAPGNQVIIGRGGQASIPPGNNTFDFVFTALSLSAPERQSFKYRLEPYDKDWVDAGTRRTAHYTNMAPGEYSFRVIAANSFGVWNSQGAGLSFVLRPHYYQTSWFYAICAISFLALLWIGYQFRLRQLQQTFNMRMAERVEERTRIARELHDTLLQSFQGLMFSFQAARNLLPGRTEEAIRTLDGAICKGDEAVAEGRDAIQNLRLGSDQRRLEDLLTATGQELRDAQDGSSRPAVFQVIIEGQPRTLDPLLQDEIYRIAREVLRNAFQHAGASRIEAAIHYDPNLFRLRIRDDGKGIDPTVLQDGARTGHWGLPGIRERAKRIGARLALWSESGAGTEVELTVPASVAYAASGVRRRFGLFPIKSKTS